MEVQPSKRSTSEESGTNKKETKNSDDELFCSDDESVSDIECELCNKQFSNVKMYEQHLNGKRHYKMLTKKKLMRKIGKSEPSNLEEDVEKESMEEITCDICSKTFSGYIPYSSHLNSNIHFKNLRKQKMKDDLKDRPEVIHEDSHNSDEDGILQKPFARCSPCQKILYDPTAFQKHMQGATHKKKLKEMKTIQNLRKEVADNAEGSDGEEDLFSTCEVCNKSFSGPVPFKIHLESTVHKKELKRAKVEEGLKDFFFKDPTTEKLICNQCNKGFTDPFSLQVHLASKSHEKQDAKEKLLSFVSSNPEIVAVKTIQNLSLDEENDETYRIGSYFFVCKFCHLSFTGPESAQDHIKSKKHIQIKTERAARKALLKKSKDLKHEEKSKVVNGSNNVSISANINENPSDITTTEFSTAQQSHNADINDDFELV